MENQNTFDMTENIPDEMFEIIGLEKDEEVPARPRIGYWADAWRRFKENKVALLAGIILLVLIFFIIFGPAISGYGYEKIDSGAINQGPSAAHALKGTPPDLLLPLHECPFASRCEYCMGICKERNPMETSLSDTHKVSCWLQHPKAPKVKSFYDKEAK